MLTTGPFIVPTLISGDSLGSHPNDVGIVLKNPTNDSLVVRVFVGICLPAAPRVPASEIDFQSNDITVPADSCLSFTILDPFIFPSTPGVLAARSIVRVSFDGAVRENSCVQIFRTCNNCVLRNQGGIETEVIGFRTSDGMHEPTMFFRHDDLISTSFV